MSTVSDPASVSRQKMEEVARQLRAGSVPMAQRAAGWIRQELQSYAPVDNDALVASVQLNLERSVSTLLSGELPTTQDAENRATTRQRMDVGVPIGDIIRAYRISLTVIYEKFLSMAEAVGMPAAQVLEDSHLLWQLGDWFTAGAAAEYRYNAAHNAVRRALERADVIRQIIGRDWTEALEDQLRDLGLELEQPYRVLMRFSREDPAGKTSAEEEVICPRAGLVAEIDGHTVAVWPARVDPLQVNVPADQCWAVGPPRAFRLLHESAAMAKRIVRVLPRTARGMYFSKDIGWRMALPLDPVVYAALSEAYLDPLQPDTSGGYEMVQTLRHYLGNGRNVRRTAEAMNVHQNTVRYRLDRIERLIGRSLDDTDVLVNLAMVLAQPADR